MRPPPRTSQEEAFQRAGKWWCWLHYKQVFSETCLIRLHYTDKPGLWLLTWKNFQNILPASWCGLQRNPDFLEGLPFIVCLRESWRLIFYFSTKGGFEGDDDLGEITDSAEESEENEEQPVVTTAQVTTPTPSVRHTGRPGMETDFLVSLSCLLQLTPWTSSFQTKHRGAGMNNREELKSIAMCSPQRRNSCRFSDCLVIHVAIIWLLSLDHVETSRWSEKEIEIALQGEFALSFCCWGHVNKFDLSHRCK